MTTREIDPVGRETVYVHGNNNVPDPDPTTGAGLDLLQVRVRNTASPSGWDVTASYTYNSQHQEASSTDASGQTTSFTYLPDGRIETEVTPAQSGPNGQPLTIAERTTTYAYYPDSDPNPTQRRRLHAITGPSSPQGAPITTYVYDSKGRMRTSTDSDNYTLTYDYDILDRQTRVTYPDGTFEQTVYERLNPTRHRDRLGRWSHRLHDALGRLVAMQDALGRTVQWHYCTCGGLDRLVDGNGNVTRWEYDLQGRVRKEFRANDPNPWEHIYENTTSRLREVMDPKQQVKTHEYFLDNNLKQVTYTGAPVPTPTVSYTYHAAHNRLSTLADGTGSTSYNYYAYASGLGRGSLESVDGPLPNDSVSYTYDEMGRIASRGLIGFMTTFRYDSLGRLASQGSLLGDFTYGYDGATGRVLSVDYPNGQGTRYAYLPNGADHRLEEIKHLAPGGSVLSRFNYTYDNPASIKTWRQQYGSSAAQVYEFGYDSADQLKTATLKSADPTPVTLKRYGYAYDAAGNRTAEQIDDAVTEEVPNFSNQLVTRQPGGTLLLRGTVSEPAAVTVEGQPARVAADNRFEGSAQMGSGTNTVTVTARDPSNNERTNTYQIPISGSTTNYTYDLNGNLTTDGARTLEWDAENRLTAVKQASTMLAAFTYDGAGRRTTKATGSVTRTYVYDQGDVVEERLSTGGSVRYVQGPGIDEPFASRDQGGVETYFLADHLGSIVQTTNANAQVTLTRSYDPWGNLQDGVSASGYAFTGREWDAEIALYYYRARFYSAPLGRFLGQDPAAAAPGISLYAYVRNRPLTSTDPLGLVDLNLFSPDHTVKKDGWAQAQQIKSAPGEFTVAGHGNLWWAYMSVGSTKLKTADYAPLSPRALADLIKAEPRWGKCTRVTLYVCGVGGTQAKGGAYAQDLANELQRPVDAPTGLIDFIDIPPYYRHRRGSRWKSFTVTGPASQ